MDCRNFTRKLDDYLEGGLDFPGRFGMERHAQQCFACGKSLTDALKLSRMARSLGRVKAPPEFESVLLARIQREGLSRQRTLFRLHPILWADRWSWHPVALAALAFAVLGIGAFFSTRWIDIGSDGSVRVARENSKSPSSRPDPAMLSGTVPMESADLRETEDTKPQTLIPDANVFTPEESGISISTGPVAGTGYVEYLVPGTGDRQIIMRLPKTIWMRYGQPSEEYYIRNVSH